MKSKKFLAMMLASVMSIGCLAGCGQAADEVTESSSASTSEEVSQTENEVSAETEESIHPITTDPITFTLMSPCHSFNTEVKGEDYWFFNWLEYKMAEMGYDVTIDVTINQNMWDQMSLMLNGGNLPDIVWGFQLDASSTVTYGVTDGIILDWTEYIDEYMPNLKAFFEEYPDARNVSVCMDGRIYGLPYVSERMTAVEEGDFPSSVAMYINQKWLDQCELEMPTTIEELIEVLRTFKEEIKLESGEEVIPYVGNRDAQRLEGYLWTNLGYYGGGVSRAGVGFNIKDGKVTLPVYTDDYDVYVDIFHTLYSEGLISEDYFTMDAATAQGLYTSGVAGVISDYVMSADLTNFADYVALPPIVIGDTKEVVQSLNSTTTINRIWAPANTEHPEVLAVLLDLVYSEEGQLMGNYGPMKGTDPLNVLDGWYVDENGAITTDTVKDETYQTMAYYSGSKVFPSFSTISTAGVDSNAMILAGEEPLESKNVEDVITGETFEITVNKAYTPDNSNGYGRLAAAEAWEGHFTTVGLPVTYNTEEDALYLQELATVIVDYATIETAKFITGERSLEEIPEFKEELKAMGIEEYIELGAKAYDFYMESIFGN